MRSCAVYITLEITKVTHVNKSEEVKNMLFGREAGIGQQNKI